MSKVKMFLPDSYVIGSSVVLDRDPKTNRNEVVIAVETMKQAGHGDVPYVRQGDPLWRKPKPAMFAQHFKNEACKRACDGDIRKATPAQLRLVPVYRAVSARFANEIRAMKRRLANKKNRLAA